MENAPSPFKHPPMFEVVGGKQPTEEINRRLEEVFNELPRLWTDYAAEVVPFLSQSQIDSATLGEILVKLNLRPEVFLEWDQQYFADNFTEIVSIAKERGSHDVY